MVDWRVERREVSSSGDMDMGFSEGVDWEDMLRLIAMYTVTCICLKSCLS